MSTTYTDSFKDTSPVAVSPPRKRSSCSCVAAGCGCIIVVLIIIGIVVAVMWKPISQNVFELMNKAVEQQINPLVENKTEDMADDPRVKDRLGAPVKVSRDESVPMNWQHPHFEFNLEGSKGKAKGVIEFEPSPQGQFEPTKVEVTFEDGTSIDLLEEPAEAEESGTEAAPVETPPTDTTTKGASLNLQPLYDAAIAHATTDVRIKQALGEPLRDELISATTQPSRSELQFIIHGANGNANGKASAEPNGASWKLSHAEVTMPDGQTIDVTEESGVDGVSATP